MENETEINEDVYFIVNCGIHNEKFWVKFEKTNEEDRYSFVTFGDYDPIGQVVFDKTTKKFIPHFSGRESYYDNSLQKTFPQYATGEHTTVFKHAVREVLKRINPTYTLVDIIKETSVRTVMVSKFQIDDLSEPLDLS